MIEKQLGISRSLGVPPSTASLQPSAVLSGSRANRAVLGRAIGIDNLAPESRHSPISKRLTNPAHGIRSLSSIAMPAHAPLADLDNLSEAMMGADLSDSVLCCPHFSLCPHGPGRSVAGWRAVMRQGLSEHRCMRFEATKIKFGRRSSLRILTPGDAGWHRRVPSSEHQSCFRAVAPAQGEYRLRSSSVS